MNPAQAPAACPAPDAVQTVPQQAAGTGAELLDRFPPRPACVSWPGTRPGRPDVLARLLAPPFALDNPLSQQQRRLGLITVVSWLEAQPGDTWQDRWLASGAEGQQDWRELVAAWKAARAGTPHASPGRLPPHIGGGLMLLICGDVIRPGTGWLLGCSPAPRNLAAEMARTRDRAAFAQLHALCQAGSMGSYARLAALDKIAVIMAAKGGAVADITVGDCAELLGIVSRVRAGKDRHSSSPFFYQLLRAWGAFGDDAPATMRVFAGHGQPTCEQLIDRYHIACQLVRDVLVDYLRERQAAMDFSSLQHYAYLLGKLFWADIEAHHPGISSLKLPRDVAAAWKQRVMTRATTRPGAAGEPAATMAPRRDGRSVLTAVRAFYLDIAEWADDDPARWGPHAVRCPVTASEASHKKDRSRRKSRMDQRTRERLPVLPTLVAWAEAERAASAERLQAAASAQPGALFTAAGQTLRRAVMKTQTSGRIWAEDPAAAKRRDLTFEEHRGFWTWAMIEVLRHTGIRIEELTELSHHSLIQYRLPATGELIPLLQIAPSKTDAERLLVISPELADTLSAIVSRIRDRDGTVPLAVGYDKNERVYNPPMPLLFQCRRQLEHQPVSETALRGYLDHALAAIGAKDTSGRPLRYTFHDFRRLFITDAILHGMPPHIAQLVAGHRDINVTMGYKAVYPEEVITGHRAFIARRRALRPAAEYRVPTDEEWDQFLGHFQRRKVALGDCGRSYDTPLHPRALLPQMPAAAPRPCPAIAPGPDLRQPGRPHRRSQGKPVAGRSRGPESQPGRRPAQTRPDGPDRRPPHRRGQPRHPRLPRRRRTHHHHPGRPGARQQVTMTAGHDHAGTGLPDALRAAALGLHPDTAGTELIISHATWLHRSDFTSRFIQHIDSTIDGCELAEIDWASAITALDAGQLPCSGGERRMLRLAASIAGGIPVSLRDTLPGLDNTSIDLVTTAIRHAAGQPPPISGFMID